MCFYLMLVNTITSPIRDSSPTDSHNPSFYPMLDASPPSLTSSPSIPYLPNHQQRIGLDPSLSLPLNPLGLVPPYPDLSYGPTLTFAKLHDTHSLSKIMPIANVNIPAVADPQKTAVVGDKVCSCSMLPRSFTSPNTLTHPLDLNANIPPALSRLHKREH
jgi:hypothetical protein